MAEQVFTDWLGEYKDLITVLTMRQFDSSPHNIKKVDDKIVKINVLNRDNNTQEEYQGKISLMPLTREIWQQQPVSPLE